MVPSPASRVWRWCGPPDHQHPVLYVEPQETILPPEPIGHSRGMRIRWGFLNFTVMFSLCFFFIVLDFSRVPGKIQIEWQSRWHKPFPKLCQFPALRSTPQSWLKMLLAVPGWLSDLPNATPGLRRLTSALSALELGPKIDAYWHS